MRGRRASALALAALAAGTVGAALAGPRERTVSAVASPSACAVGAGPLSYPWPIKPFHVAHPVRGNFGDPRTVYRANGGRFSFHNGVDIVAPDTTSVYPVESGTVTERRPDELVVQADDGRSFQYFHLLPLVNVGQRVVRGSTVLGFVKPGAHHVHLTELQDGIVQNPLAPGHLTPYRDAIPPTVTAISFLDPDGNLLPPDRLAGRVRVVAEAYDLPSLPVPGAWHGFPVSPAALSWELTLPGGQDVVPEQVTVDFREGQPPDSQFWRVYARGTMQNFPVVGRRFLYRHAGTYLFHVTPAPLETAALAPGRYLLTVTALDVCGNRGSRTVPIDVLPQASILRGALPDERVRSWPSGLSGYTVVLTSVPAGEGRAAAVTEARRAEAAGLTGVGVLSSSRFTGFEPGYDVVFAGDYATPWAAERALARVTSVYPDAYPRELTPAAASRPESRARREARAPRPRAQRSAAGAPPAAATPRPRASRGERAR